MTNELSSLLENKRCGEAQVAARKAHIATLNGEESDGHKAALAREEADLAAVTSLVASLMQDATPSPIPTPAKPKKP